MEKKIEEQQYCLRWKNFQANITSQFEALRDDEDFTDVTIACEGQKLQAHRVVLSACSPYFKEIFKANPCSHPIIFMRDVEARHVTALLEFMYAGEVNIAQAHLSTFLKTAESLKIRGLTDSPSEKHQETDTLTLNPKCKQQKTTSSARKRSNSISNQAVLPTPAACSSTVTSSQDDNSSNLNLVKIVKPSTIESNDKLDNKRANSVKFDEEDDCLLNTEDDLLMDEDDNDNDINIDIKEGTIEPKLELGDYLSDDEGQGYYAEGLDGAGVGALLEGVNFQGGMEIIPQSNSQGFQPTTTPKRHVHNHKHTNHRPRAINNPPVNQSESFKSSPSSSARLHSLDPRPCDVCGRVYSNLSNLRQHMKLIHYPTHVNCTLCQKPFKTDLYLRRHMSTAHYINAGIAMGGDLNAVIGGNSDSDNFGGISIEDILSGHQVQKEDNVQSGLNNGTFIGKKCDGSVGVVGKYRVGLGMRNNIGGYNLRR